MTVIYVHESCERESYVRESCERESYVHKSCERESYVRESNLHTIVYVSDNHLLE